MRADAGRKTNACVGIAVPICGRTGVPAGRAVMCALGLNPASCVRPRGARIARQLGFVVSEERRPAEEAQGEEGEDQHEWDQGLGRQPVDQDSADQRAESQPGRAHRGIPSAFPPCDDVDGDERHEERKARRLDQTRQRADHGEECRNGGDDQDRPVGHTRPLV